MKTTLNLDDHLARAAKRRAAETGRTLTGMIETALRAQLDAEKRASKKTAFAWPVVRGKTPPAADINDRDALYDRMSARA